MRMWKSLLAGAGIALVASCGSEPTSVRAPEQPSLNHGGTFNVDIQGPQLVTAGYTCEWEPAITGGTPPYNYLWMGWNNQIEYGATFVSSASIGGQILYLEVSDSAGNWDSATISVNGTSSWQVGCGG